MRIPLLCLFLGLLLYPFIAWADKSAAVPPNDVITGKLLMPDGTPIAKTTVTMYGIDPKADTLATATTDAQGVFCFAGKDNLFNKCKDLALIADVPGMAFASQRIWPGIESVDLRPSPPTELDLALVDTAGKPIAPSQVSITSVQFTDLGSIIIPSAMQPRFTRRTDAKGACRIPLLPQGATITLDLPASRYAKFGFDQTITLDKGPVTQVPPITLLPASSLGGQVVYSTTGKPVAGVKVYADSKAAHCMLDGKTDRHGRFLFTRLRPGSYNVAAFLDKLSASWVVLPRQGVQVPQGSAIKDVRLELFPGATITGRTLAEGTSEPIEGVSLLARQSENLWVTPVHSGAGGRYCVHVPPGKVTLEFPNNYMQPKGVGKPAVTTHTLNVKDGEIITQDFTLPFKLLKPIHGHVLGPDEQPVAGATVYFIPVNAGDYLQKPTVTTDDTGAFTFDPGVPVTMLAYKGTMGIPQEVTLPDGGEVTVHLTPDFLATVTGLVTNNAGDPLPNIHVNLYQPITERQSYDAPAATTDAEGRYRISPVWPNKPYSIQADRNTGYGNGYVSGNALKSGEQATAHEMILQKLDSSVAGTVVDEKGAPVNGISVGINGQTTPYQHMTTGYDGKFHFDAVDGDHVSLWCYDRSGGNGNIDVTASGQSDIVLVLKHGKS